MLCQLSYIGPLYLWRKAVRLRVARYGETAFAWLAEPKRTFTSKCERRLERETGIEPATNSLEGCDSTTELLPPTPARSCAASPVTNSTTVRVPTLLIQTPPTAIQPRRPSALLTNCPLAPATRSELPSANCTRPCPLAVVAKRGPESTGGFPSPPTSRANSNSAWRIEVGGEGRVRTSVATRAADLQSAAIDRSATSP